MVMTAKKESTGTTATSTSAITGVRQRRVKQPGQCEPGEVKKMKFLGNEDNMDVAAPPGA